MKASNEILALMLERAKVESEIRGVPLKDMLELLASGKPLPQVESRQAGRPAKKPEGFDPNWHGLDVFADDFRAVLRNLNAPPAWNDELEFMVACLCVPGKVIEANEEGLAAAVRFCDIYAQNPRLFLRTMLRIQQVIAKKTLGRVNRLAAAHAASDALWRVKVNAIGPQRIIEDAREATRKAHPFSPKSDTK